MRHFRGSVKLQDEYLVAGGRGRSSPRGWRRGYGRGDRGLAVRKVRESRVGRGVGTGGWGLGWLEERGRERVGGRA